VEGRSIRHHQVEHARTSAHEDIERFDGRVRECYTPRSPEYTVIPVRKPDIFHPSKSGTRVIEHERHASGIDPVLLDFLGLEIHHQTEGGFLLLHGGRARRCDPKNNGRPNPDPHRSGHGDAEG